MQPARGSEIASLDAEQLLYTPKEAAVLVSLTAHWLVTRARNGEIPHHRIGRLYRFGREDLEEIKKMHAQPISKRRNRALRGD